jgi:hypothetical protein
MRVTILVNHRMIDGHWFYITPSGGRIHATPDNTTIKDGHWFDEAPAVDGVGHYIKDQYGNYIEYPIEAATPSANTTTVTSSNDEDNSTAQAYRKQWEQEHTIHNLKHDETHTAGALPSPTIEGIWGVSFELHDAINSSSRVEQSLKPAQLGPINPVCHHVP